MITRDCGVRGAMGSPRRVRSSTTGTTRPRRLSTPRTCGGASGMRVISATRTISRLRRMGRPNSSRPRKKVTYGCTSASGASAAAVGRARIASAKLSRLSRVGAGARPVAGTPGRSSDDMALAPARLDHGKPCSSGAGRLGASLVVGSGRGPVTPGPEARLNTSLQSRMGTTRP